MPSIGLDGVSVQYEDTSPLRDVSVEFCSGSIGIMGPSGSGKSTLLRVIAGLQTPTQGSVMIDASPVKTPSWKSAGDLRIAMIHQDYRLVPFLTVAQNLLLAAEARGLDPDESHVLTALERVGLASSLSDRLPRSLSGGEQQRVAIARALLSGASVIVADEPTGALDSENTARVAEILSDLGSCDELAVVVATHDSDVAARLGHRWRLAEGKLWALE